MKVANDILNTFEIIQLNEMGNVSLMDRTDTKFTFLASVLPFILQKLSAHYKVLQINNNLLSTYKTLYFDTPALELYLKHHNGHMNRYKVRYRNYVESNTGFLEVKFKNNKGKTSKSRIEQKGTPEQWDETALQFLNKKTPYDPQLLKPQVWINYQRITLVDKEFKERVTIDLNLEFLSGSLNRKLSNLVIAEIKRASHVKSPAAAILKEFRIKEESLSKYCLGMTHIYPHIKKNNFKETLNTLNKIIYDKSISATAGI